MDLTIFEAIAHRDLKYCSPLRSVMVDEVAEIIGLKPADRVIDIGCAKGEILIRLAELCQISAVGIDTSPQHYQSAQEQIAMRVPAADISLHETPVGQFPIEADSYDVVMCVNSSNLFDSFDDALNHITSFAKSGGWVLMGDYYWHQSPIEGAKITAVTHTYDRMVQAGIQQGLVPFYATVCTQIDIDRYLWLQIASIEKYALENSDDPQAMNYLNHARALRDEFVNRTRSHLGFGLFLFHKP